MSSTSIVAGNAFIPLNTLRASTSHKRLGIQNDMPSRITRLFRYKVGHLCIEESDMLTDTRRCVSLPDCTQRSVHCLSASRSQTSITILIRRLRDDLALSTAFAVCPSISLVAFEFEREHCCSRSDAAVALAALLLNCQCAPISITR